MRAVGLPVYVVHPRVVIASLLDKTVLATSGGLRAVDMLSARRVVVGGRLSGALRDAVPRAASIVRVRGEHDPMGSLQAWCGRRRGGLSATVLNF